MKGLLKDVKGAAGMAYAINGKLYSIDLYNNHRLFSDLFEKLLDAAIAEAISEEISEGESSTMHFGKILEVLRFTKTLILASLPGFNPPNPLV